MTQSLYEKIHTELEKLRDLIQKYAVSPYDPIIEEIALDHPNIFREAYDKFQKANAMDYTWMIPILVYEGKEKGVGLLTYDFKAGWNIYVGEEIPDPIWEEIESVL